jgi:tight adherence protein B
LSGLLTLPQLLGCGAGLLALMGGASVFVLRHDRLQQKLASRVDAIATPYARANPLQVMGQRRSWVSARQAGTVLFRLFGYDPTRASHYPCSAAVVLVIAIIAAGIVAQIAGALFGTMANLAVPVLWVVISRKIFAWFEQKRSNRLYLQFPDALAMIVRAVRVGIPVSEAVRNVSREALEPTASEFGVLSDQLTIGIALEEALGDIATRSRLPEYRFFATALSLQAQTGGGLSETLENLADVIRKRVAVRNRAYALAGEARASTYILAALPVVTALALTVINPAYIGLLFTDPTGRAVLAAAVGMLSTGMTVMRMTITRSLR